ncbi:MAG TPA: NapC/NirT family cytochrome c [Xanthobacteraceae bacterium]|nr:NapC/NirT family cytochrome c [Xanthobacteraceae bacterium]
MAGKRWLGAIALLVVGGAVGAGGIIASTFMNQYTSTDRFCTSCHTMAVVATEPHALNSAHESNAAGFRVGCADCHTPATNWFTETYLHGVSSVRDTFAEFTHDYSRPGVWNARRRELAGKVRDEMRANDSLTCRRCHDAAAIRPASESGRAAHAMVVSAGMTCVQCHANLVHAPQ